MTILMNDLQMLSNYGALVFVIKFLSRSWQLHRNARFPQMNH